MHAHRRTGIASSSRRSPSLLTNVCRRVAFDGRKMYGLSSDRETRAEFPRQDSWSVPTRQACAGPIFSSVGFVWPVRHLLIESSSKTGKTNIQTRHHYESQAERKSDNTNGSGWKNSNTKAFLTNGVEKNCSSSAAADLKRVESQNHARRHTRKPVVTPLPAEAPAEDGTLKLALEVARQAACRQATTSCINVPGVRVKTDQFVYGRLEELFRQAT